MRAMVLEHIGRITRDGNPPSLRAVAVPERRNGEVRIRVLGHQVVGTVEQ